jgi:hypothetical protein
MRYKGKNWSMELPEGWLSEEDQDCVTFYNHSGVGALQVSSYQKDQIVIDDDLREFAGEVPLANISFGPFTGFRTRFSEGEVFWIKWWLRAATRLIYLTYNCQLSHRGREDAEVQAMLQSLLAD